GKWGGNGGFWVRGGAAGGGVVQAVARRVRFGAGAPDLAAGAANDLGADLFRVLPHHQFVRPPVEMKPRHWNPEDVFCFGIYVEVVARSGKRRRLKQKADRRRVIAADGALEPRAETFELFIVARKPSAATVRVDRVTANELLFERAFQILPSRHPNDGRVGDVVGRGRLTDQLRQEAVGRSSVKMIADISP